MARRPSLYTPRTAACPQNLYHIAKKQHPVKWEKRWAIANGRRRVRQAFKCTGGSRSHHIQHEKRAGIPGLLEGNLRALIRSSCAYPNFSTHRGLQTSTTSHTSHHASPSPKIYQMSITYCPPRTPNVQPDQPSSPDAVVQTRYQYVSQKMSGNTLRMIRQWLNASFSCHLLIVPATLASIRR